MNTATPREGRPARPECTPESLTLPPEVEFHTPLAVHLDRAEKLTITIGRRGRVQISAEKCQGATVAPAAAFQTPAPRRMSREEFREYFDRVFGKPKAKPAAAPATPPAPTAQPVDDSGRPDVPTPSPETVYPHLRWHEINPTGELRSACNRFRVVSNHICGGLWQAEDHATGEKTGQLSVKGHAMAWCEERWRGETPTELETPAAPSVSEPVIAPEELLDARPILEWITHPNGQSESSCGRFKITPKRNREEGEVIPETFFASDLRVKSLAPNARPGRFSPDGSFSECCEWCEERAEEPLAEQNGEPVIKYDPSIPF